MAPTGFTPLRWPISRSGLRPDAQGGALCHDLVDWGEDVVNHYHRGRDSGIEAGAPGDSAGASLPVLGDTGTGRRGGRQPGTGAQGARILRRRDRVLRRLVYGGNGQGAESGPDGGGAGPRGEL